MPRHKVVVDEHVVYEYIVDAPDEEEAKEIVRAKGSELEPEDADIIHWFIAEVVKQDEDKSP